MSFKSELKHVLQPKRTQLTWTLGYIVVAIAVLIGFFLIANRIQTHTVPVGGISIGTTYSKYAIGETVSVSVTNNYNTTVFITNQCPAEPMAIYRQSDKHWVRLHATAVAKDCPGEQRQVGIPSSSTVTLSLAPWHQLFTEPGNYRVVAVLDGYGSLPYADFSVMALPTPVAAVATNQGSVTKSVSGGALSISLPPGTSTSSTGLATPPASNTPLTSTPPPSPAPVPKTVVLHVTSAGMYDLMNLSLHTGDTLQIVYNPPIGNEVRTHFRAIAPTTTALSSLTVDSEFRTRSMKMMTAGSWSFAADDHSGNSGVITVN